MNTFARYVEADDYPIGVPADVVDAFLEVFATEWGSIQLLAMANPGADREFLERTAPVTRASATPRTAAAQWRNMLRHDVRHVLPLVQAPTLVLHVSEQLFTPLDHGRYLAEHIDGSRFVQLPGGDLSWTSGNQVVADEVAEFLTGQRPEVEVDRILTTVLFTDIVGSTEHAASVGDARWRRELDAHDRAVREELRRFRGREINTTGDGFVAAFDGPARAVRCARAIVEATGRLGLRLRAGLHTGECEVRGDDLGGLAVHIAARVASRAGDGEILVSGTVKDLVAGSELAFTERGAHALHGVPDRWHLFAVSG
jgi:class 3 adenylate cyclase